MIDYHTFSQIKQLTKDGLKTTQIAQKLLLDPRTVSFWQSQERFRQRKTPNSILIKTISSVY
jgi:hypothetical protein